MRGTWSRDLELSFSSDEARWDSCSLQGIAMSGIKVNSTKSEDRRVTRVPSSFLASWRELAEGA